MSTPYIGEIRIFAGNFAPVEWAFCNGQLLPISDYDALFTLIGTTYGGDGQQTFALPDLRGRVPVHQGTLSGGSSYVIGQVAGSEQVTLTAQQLPAHNHPMVASDGLGTSPNPGGELLAESTTATMYATGSPTATMAGASIGPVGGSLPHTNLQPSLCVDFIIALVGVFPTQS